MYRFINKIHKYIAIANTHGYGDVQRSITSNAQQLVDDKNNKMEFQVKLLSCRDKP